MFDCVVYFAWWRLRVVWMICCCFADVMSDCILRMVAVFVWFCFDALYCLFCVELWVWLLYCFGWFIIWLLFAIVIVRLILVAYVYCLVVFWLLGGLCKLIVLLWLYGFFVVLFYYNYLFPWLAVFTVEIVVCFVTFALAACKLVCLLRVL